MGYKLSEGKYRSGCGSQVYDFSLTKNVVQMIIALTILVLLMTGIAQKIQTQVRVLPALEGLAKCAGTCHNICT